MNYTRNIKKIINNTTKKERKDGIKWYSDVNSYCRLLSNMYSLPLWKVSAIMAVLSPRTSFKNNASDTHTFLRTKGKGKLKSPLFKEKAIKIYKTKTKKEAYNYFSEKTARKTLSFWENINLEGERVTIDIHMIRSLGIDGSLTTKKYREAEQAIQKYAHKVKLKPYELQAILWVAVRGNSY